MLAGEATVEIAATPEAVYDVVSDVTRTGQWSPQCERCEWNDGATGPAPGARFTGHNREGSREWSAQAVVEQAVPGRLFSFHTEFNGVARTRWSYRLEPAGSGTRVTESYERLTRPPLLVRVVEATIRRNRKAENDANIRASLDRLKSVVEGAVT